MRLVLLTLLLLTPATAFAMPPAVAAAAAWIASTVGVELATAYLIIQVAITVAVSVYGSAQQRRAAKRAAAAQRDAYNSGLQERTVTRIATEAPHVYVYGEARVGSAIVAMFTSGDRDQYKHLVCVHAAHECESIQEIYVAGKPLGTLDGSGNATGAAFVDYSTGTANESYSTGTFTLLHTPVAGSLTLRQVDQDWNETTLAYTLTGSSVVVSGSIGGFSPIYATYQYSDPYYRVRAQKHLGAAGQTADASLRADVPALWPATATLNGLCYTVIRLDLNHPEFQGGPPSVEALIRGKKVLDVRTSVTAWSNNNALCTYDYLRSEMCGIDAADIPTADYITAANVCDATNATDATIPVALGKRYTMNGTVTSEQAQAGVLEAMAQSMAGSIIATTWGVSAGKYVAPVLATSDADIVGQLAVTPGLADADLYNGIRGQFVGAANSYVVTDFTPYKVAAYVTADGQELWTDISFQFTDTLQRVHNLARIFTEDQRAGYTIKAEFSLKLWDLQIGERVTFTSTLLGLSAAVFRLTDKKYSASGPVECTFKQDAASIWDFADAVTAPASPATNLPNPYAIAKIASVTCSSGTGDLLVGSDGSVVSRIHVTWPIATTQAVLNGGLIDVEWAGTDGVWRRTSVAGDQTGCHIAPVRDGSYYTVRVRAVNPYLNVRADWTYAAIHQVIGKTEAPAAPDTFLVSRQPDGTRQFTWAQANPPADLDGYRIRSVLGASGTWATMTPMHAGALKSSPWETNQLAAGTYTFAIKSVDTTGNESTNAVYIETTIGDPRLGGAIDGCDSWKEGWPGTKTACHIVPETGFLSANDTAASPWLYAWSAFRWIQTPAGTISYERQFDIGVITPFTPLATATGTGTQTITESHSNDGTTWSAYAAVGALITASYVRVKVQLVHTWPVLQNVTITLSADVVTEDIEDLTTSTLTGAYRIAVGDIRLPITEAYAVVKKVDVTLQNVGAGWSWELIDKTTAVGPRIKIYNASNVLADAVIDATIRGL